MSGTYVVIVAAGRGTRFGGALPKQYLALGGASVLRHAVAVFAAHPRITGVQVVIRDEDHLRNACEYVRQNPVRAGLCEEASNWPWAGSRS